MTHYSTSNDNPREGLREAPEKAPEKAKTMALAFPKHVEELEKIIPEKEYVRPLQLT